MWRSSEESLPVLLSSLTRAQSTSQVPETSCGWIIVSLTNDLIKDDDCVE